MSEPVDLASAIGTWLAVFIALVALLGVVGPFLVWKASKTERNLALKAIDSGQAENGGFITHGVPFWPGVRLFRRVKAPMLLVLPPVQERILNWDRNVAQVSKDSASWVKFGVTIRSYGIQYELGDPLHVETTRTFLPVNKAYILIIGLLGRFGIRRDEGKMPRARVKGVQSVQAIPGADIGKFGKSRQVSFQDEEDKFPGWMTSKPRWTDYDSRSRSSSRRNLDGFTYEQLHGLVGTLYTEAASRGGSRSDGVSRMHFSVHQPQEIGELDPDQLTIGGLFWLAVGCIPMADGRVFSLENVQFLALDGESDSEDEHEDGDGNENSGRERMVHLASPRPAAAWDEPEDPEPYLSFHEQVSPAIYVPSPTSARRSVVNQYTGARGFKFSPTINRVALLGDIAEAVGVERSNPTVLSLEEVIISPDERLTLENLGKATYTPPDLPWVRLSAANKSSRHGAASSWYLRRTDAHSLAQSLLRLPICRKGYLFHASKASICREFLCSAASNLPFLLAYLVRNAEYLDIAPPIKRSLLGPMKDMLGLVQRFHYSRVFMTAICDLDRAIQKTLPRDAKVSEALGAIIISSPEFRDLVTLSIRRFQQSAQQTIQLDLQDPAVVLKAVLGVEQRFPVELTSLFPTFASESRVIEITFTSLAMSFLKASLRSAFLKTSLNSLPLFERVMGQEETIFLG